MPTRNPRKYCMFSPQLDAQVKLLIFHTGQTESEVFREVVRLYCNKELEEIRKKEAEEALLKKVNEHKNRQEAQ